MYFTGVLPITLDDLSSGFNVGTVVSLRSDMLGLVGFSKSQTERYVDDIFAEHGLPAELKPTVLGDLERFYDGYHFVPGAAPSSIRRSATGTSSSLSPSAGSPSLSSTRTCARTSDGSAAWRRPIRGPWRSSARGEGEDVVMSALSAKFGRAKFFSEDFYPYALYYLGLLTYEDEMTLNIPNLCSLTTTRIAHETTICYNVSNCLWDGSDVFSIVGLCP